MADDKAEDASVAPDSGRAKRAPPTIDLQATEVATQPQQPTGETQPEAEPEQVKTEPESERAEANADAAPTSASPTAKPPKPISPWVIAPFSGAAAAALVIAVGSMLGWPAVKAPPAVQTPPVAPQVTTATVDALTGRLASVEAKLNKPSAPVADPATTARIDALEKSLDGLRSDVANLRARPEEPAGSQEEAKSEPHETAAASDLSAINERIASLESGIRAEQTQLGEKIAAAKAVADKAAGDQAASDKPLRRVVAASLLDVAARHGDPYEAQLSAARSLAADPDQLKPLDVFAASGIPSPQVLCRELLDIVPKLAPPEAQSSDAGIVDRLQTGAKKLFRIERIDGATGNDRGAIVSRMTAAALRNDFNAARRELKTLPEADREPAQAWLDRANEREAALAASRKFADDAMADIAKPVSVKPAPVKPAEQ